MRARLLRLALSGPGLLALVLAACTSGTTAPELTIYAGTDATGTLIESDYHLVPDTGAETLDLFVQAAGSNRLYAIRCTLDGVDVDPTATTGGIMNRSASYSIGLTEEHMVLEFRTLDKRLYETVRELHVYYDPDIIDQVFMSGKGSDETQCQWVGYPLRLIVALHQGIAGAYDITVAAAPWNGSSYDIVEAVPYSTDLVFPATAGLYQYTVRAEDPGSGDGEDVVFPVYVQDVDAVDDWSGGFGTYTHAVTGKNLSVSWGDLDTAMGEGLWIVEIISETDSKPWTTGTSATVAFDDVGEYFARVGRRDEVSATSPYTYSTLRSLGYVGTNTDPNAPTAPPVPAAISDTTGGTWSFDISGTDPDGDPLVYVMTRGSFPLSVTYDSETAVYGWSYNGTTGTFGDEDEDDVWEFTWTVEPGTFGGATTFYLSFYGVDRFSAYSPARNVSFTVTP